MIFDESLLTRNHPRRFGRALVTLILSKKDSLDEAEQDVWHEQLSDLPIDAVEDAAKKFAKQDERFLPSVGEWYALADRIAAARLADDDIVALPPAVTPEREAEGRIRRARDTFLTQWGARTGTPIGDDHPLKTAPITVPTYSCTICHDTGWVENKNIAASVEFGYDVLQASHCVCWDHNATLQRYRAKAHIRQKGHAA
jgi:hypothetical protein|tara:strand:- start:555 stop:1151 length:597 start_codon:yes stop_codon:yes gene_type:complete